MESCNTTGKNLLQKLQDLLVTEPDTLDVTFLVGPLKKQVKALKVILKASSPVFKKEFRERWEGLIASGEEILLQQFDPDVFQLFIDLLMTDSWTCESLENQKLTLDQMLSVLIICQHYEMHDAMGSLNELINAHFKSFPNGKKHESFLCLTQTNLRAVLSFDHLAIQELDIFYLACRWAEFQCESQNLETTVENLRTVLGECVYEIRFPLMSNTEFTKAIEHKGILTLEECLQIYKFIGSENDKKKEFNPNEFRFKTTPRALPVLLVDKSRKLFTDSSPISMDGSQKYQNWAESRCGGRHIETTCVYLPGVCSMDFPTCPLSPSADWTSTVGNSNMLSMTRCLNHLNSMEWRHGDINPLLPAPSEATRSSFETIYLKKGFHLIENFRITCDGTQKYLNLLVKVKTELVGLGFHSQCDTDTKFDVGVQVYDHYLRKWIGTSGNKNVFASGGKVFYIFFQEPIILDARSLDWKNSVNIYYTLKETSIKSHMEQLACKEPSVVEKGNEFQEIQIAEILYRRSQ